MPGLLVTISHLMGERKVELASDHLESCVLFMALIGNPSTGKSTELNVLRDSVLEIESFEEIKDCDSSLVQGFFIHNIDSI